MSYGTKPRIFHFQYLKVAIWRFYFDAIRQMEPLKEQLDHDKKQLLTEKENLMSFTYVSNT